MLGPIRGFITRANGTKEGECLLLEAVTRGLVKTQLIENTMHAIVNCRLCRYIDCYCSCDLQASNRSNYQSKSHL
jgi:hypothetical protein